MPGFQLNTAAEVVANPDVVVAPLRLVRLVQGPSGEMLFEVIPKSTKERRRSLGYVVV